MVCEGYWAKKSMSSGVAFDRASKVELGEQAGKICLIKMESGESFRST